MKKIAALSLLLVTIFGCSAQKGKDRHDGYTIVKQESYGGRETAGNETITTQAELVKLYAELNIEEVPSIDFKKQNVVALFMGQKRTGGYTISIGSLDVLNDTATIKVLETTPEGGMATMALTAPYCIASIPKTAKVVVVVQ